MSLSITKKCFPTASQCFNCKRKSRDEIIETKEPNKEYRRCSGCHLLTYCDEACQKEHWQKVHKAHCKYLSGKKPVENSLHNKESCTLCIQQKTTCLYELCSSNSPKTICHIEEVAYKMKLALGIMFDFHGEGRGCKCSLDAPCELQSPFPLGEVSGEYVGQGLTGLDQMVAHAIKILKAMTIKSRHLDNGIKETLHHLFQKMIAYRASLWRNILIYGVPKSRETKEYLGSPVNNLKVIYGHDNAWWKALAFTVDNIVDMSGQIDSDFKDSRSLQDPRFSSLKQTNDYDLSQLKNMAFVSENKLWSNFKFWPMLTEKSLILLLPNGTRCQSCRAALTGQVRISEEETDESLPILHPGFGENGGLMACCSRKDLCMLAIIFKLVRLNVQIDKERWINLEKEQKIFFTVSRSCDLCLKESLFSHRCAACYAAQYCSTDCQIEDQPFHKTVCSTWANDKFRKIVGSKMQKKVYKEHADKYFK